MATAGLGSLRRLGELTAGDVSFEDLERIIASDVGLSLKLLRYVNSAFFALPRTVGSVREALVLLGVRTVRRWATVMAISAIPDVPDELVALGLRRARMCEMLAGSALPEERETLFTIGLFSVADALLDAPMAEVLDSLPFTDEIQVALLRREGPKGELLAAVTAYERGEFPRSRPATPASRSPAPTAPRSSGPTKPAARSPSRLRLRPVPRPCPACAAPCRLSRSSRSRVEAGFELLRVVALEPLEVARLAVPARVDELLGVRGERAEAAVLEVAEDDLDPAGAGQHREQLGERRMRLHHPRPRAREVVGQPQAARRPRA